MIDQPAPTDTEELKLTRNGEWLSNGVPVTHAPQIDAFFRHIGRDDQGWFISIGKDFKRIEVEDTGFFVLSLDGDPRTGIELNLSDGTRQRLDPATLKFQPGRLTCRIRGGTEEAKFLPIAYFELMRELQEDATCYFVVVEGTRVVLATK